MPIDEETIAASIKKNEKWLMKNLSDCEFLLANGEKIALGDVDCIVMTDTSEFDEIDASNTSPQIFSVSTYMEFIFSKEASFILSKFDKLFESFLVKKRTPIHIQQASCTIHCVEKYSEGQSSYGICFSDAEWSTLDRYYHKNKIQHTIGFYATEYSATKIT